MDLDFSLLTFSPSQRSIKSSGAGKSSSKRTLLQRQLHSAVGRKSPVYQVPCAYTTNVSSGQEKLPWTDLTVCDTAHQSFDALHHKSVFKSRVRKGKENRGINSYTVDLSSDSGRLSTTDATNFRKSCCRLACDQLQEDGSTRKKPSNKAVTTSPISNTMDDLVSKMYTCASRCAKSCVSSERYFSYCSSVDETCNKRRDNDSKVNCSVIVVSDSDSVSSAINDGIPKLHMKHSLSSSIRKRKKDVKEVECLIVDTSDSENDVLDASFEAPRKLTWNVRTPVPSDLKFRACSSTKCEKVGSPVANLEFTLSAKPLQLNHTKYQDIENWLSKMKPLKSGEYDDADTILEGSSVQKDEVTGGCPETGVSLEDEVTGNGSSTSVFLSAEGSPDDSCGTTWRKTGVHVERPQSELRRKKCSGSEQITRQRTKCKKQTVAESEHSTVSSTESEEFEKFLKNVRQKFESARRDSVLGTPDFIDDDDDDDDQDNSLAFYQGLLNSRDLKRDQSHLNWKRDGSGTLCANRKLSFSSGDSDGPTREHSSDENHDMSKARTNRKKLHDVEKKKHVKRPQKIIVSPVKRSLVNRTPKTVGQPRIKSCVDKQVSKFCSPVLSFLASLSANTPNGRCHPEARYYKTNFKKKKEELCKKLFSLYNDKVFDNKLPHDMLVEWNTRMKQTAGFCYNRRTVTSCGTKVRSSRIAISTKVCDTADRLRDTLIHEMCHAAVWVLDGVRNGHGHLWNAWARKAACVFPELPPIKRCHDYSIQTKFTYRCTRCGYSIGRHSKSLDVVSKRCGLCYGVFELLVNTRRKSGTIAQQAVKSRSPTGFARFVKENYGAVKQSRTDLKHADIMRLLGQQFSAMKIVPGARKQ